MDFISNLPTFISTTIQDKRSTEDMHPVDASDFSKAESEVVTASTLVLMHPKYDRYPYPL